MRLTPDEARDLARRLREWPPGLGFVLEPHAGPRGWRRLPGYRPFAPPPRADGDGVLYCPVVRLHEARRPADERSYYAGHLDAFWTIAQALAEVWNVPHENARVRYNHLLKTDPAQLVEALERYADAPRLSSRR